MLSEQNVCVEPIIDLSNPILTEFVMMFVSPPYRHHLMQSKWVPDHIQFLKSTITKSVFILANNQTLLGCILSGSTLFICSFFACIQPVPQACTFNFRLAITDMVLSDKFIEYNQKSHDKN